MAKKEEQEAPEEDKKEEGEGAAEGGEGGEAAEGGGDAGKKKKMIIMIAGGVVVLLIAVAAGLYFTGMLDSLMGKKPAVECDEHDEACKEEQAKAAEEGGHGEAAAEGGGGEHGGGGGGGGHGEAGSSAFLEIPPMIVNLNTEDGTPRYLRLSVQLELKDPGQKGAVEAVMPKVIDQFQTYLRELRVKDLRGSAGIYRLQMELLWRVNQAASPVEIKDVLFQEILIQ